LLILCNQKYKVFETDILHVCGINHWLHPDFFLKLVNDIFEKKNETTRSVVLGAKKISSQKYHLEGFLFPSLMKTDNTMFSLVSPISQKSSRAQASQTENQAMPHSLSHGTKTGNRRRLHRWKHQTELQTDRNMNFIKQGLQALYSHQLKLSCP
jgi:hypothetical protein